MNLHCLIQYSIFTTIRSERETQYPKFEFFPQKPRSFRSMEEKISKYTMLNFSHLDLPAEYYLMLCVRLVVGIYILLLGKSIFTLSLFFTEREYNGIMITVFCYAVLSSFVHRSRRCCRLRKSPMAFNWIARISLFSDRAIWFWCSYDAKTIRML